MAFGRSIDHEQSEKIRALLDDPFVTSVKVYCDDFKPSTWVSLNVTTTTTPGDVIITDGATVEAFVDIVEDQACEFSDTFFVDLTPVALPHNEDADNLASFVKVVQRVPGAAWANVTSSDQGPYGFVLLSIELTDGKRLKPEVGVLPNGVIDDAGVALQDIDWNGVVGEDEHGDARIPVAFLDYSSSNSRQHYIETGRYLSIEEAKEHQS